MIVPYCILPGSAPGIAAQSLRHERSLMGLRPDYESSPAAGRASSIFGQHYLASLKVTIRLASSSHNRWSGAEKASRKVTTRAVAKAGCASWHASSR